MSLINQRRRITVDYNGGGNGTGPQGPQGPSGIDGKDGIDGSVGPQGPQGVKGDSLMQGATVPIPYDSTESLTLPLSSNFNLVIKGASSLSGKYVQINIKNVSASTKKFNYNVKVEGGVSVSKSELSLVPEAMHEHSVSIKCDLEWMTRGFVHDIETGTVSYFTLMTTGQQEVSGGPARLSVFVVNA